MRSLLTTVKRFLTAEEVPRWFGLSIVLIYLVGLGSVAHYAVTQARYEGASQLRKHHRYAVALLADRLSALSNDLPSDAAFVDVCQHELNAFCANVPVRSLRLIDGNKRIIASADPAEVGSMLDAVRKSDHTSDGLHAVESPTTGPQHGLAPCFALETWIRTPVPLHKRRRAHGADDPAGPLSTTPSGAPVLRNPLPHSRGSVTGPGTNSTTADGDAPPGGTAERPRSAAVSLPRTRTAPSVGATTEAKQTSATDSDRPLILEAVLRTDPLGATALVGQAWTLVVVLVVLGALFVTYRCLRQQLRGVSRIAERLQTPRDQLEDELDALRIADSLDSVTRAWNDLIGLTQRLHETVERSEADRELTQVLQHSGGALPDALQTVPDAIILVTDEVRFEYVNVSAARLFGWSAEEAARATLPDAQATGVGGEVLELLRGALRSDGCFAARTVVLNGKAASPTSGGDDHSAYRVRLTPMPRTRRSGTCVVMIQDVSQQIRAERAHEEFITQVTHELRTPLTNIRAYTETLSSGMFDDPSVITECYNVITKETRRLSRLVEDVLNVSQLEVGTIELHVDDVDIKTLLSDGVRDVRGLADEKDIDLQLVLPAKVELIRADRDKLAIVINNLLANAIKYTPRDGNVIVGFQASQDEAIITVKDNGIGIDPADQARVFEKFQRAQDPDVQQELGTGIGLYTAREIVRRHRGAIEVISEKGEGSTFLVRLPQKRTRTAALSTADEA